MHAIYQFRLPSPASLESPTLERNVRAVKDDDGEHLSEEANGNE